MARLEPLTEESKQFSADIKLPTSGLTLGRSLNAPACLALPVQWLQVGYTLSMPSANTHDLPQVMTDEAFVCSAREGIAASTWKRCASACLSETTINSRCLLAIVHHGRFLGNGQHC